MKTKLIALATLTAFSAIPLFYTGCAESGYEKVAKTTSEVTDFQSSLAGLTGNIQATNGLLTSLVNDTTTDPTQRFKAFSDSVDQVISADSKVRAAGTDLQASARNAVQQRRLDAAKITDDTLRTQAGARATAYEQRFDNIKSVTANASQSVQDYVAKLTDLRTSLGSSLSPSSLSAAVPFASKAIESGNAAVVNIGQLNGLLQGAAAEAAAKAAPPTAEKNSFF